MTLAKLYKPKHIKELSGFRASMKCNNLFSPKSHGNIICTNLEWTLALITFEGLLIPNPPRQSSCLMTNVAVGNQVSFNSEVTKTAGNSGDVDKAKLPAVTEVTTQQS